MRWTHSRRFFEFDRNIVDKKLMINLRAPKSRFHARSSSFFATIGASSAEAASDTSGGGVLVVYLICGPPGGLSVGG